MPCLHRMANIQDHNTSSPSATKSVHDPSGSILDLSSEAPRSLTSRLSRFCLLRPCYSGMFQSLRASGGEWKCLASSHWVGDPSFHPCLNRTVELSLPLFLALFAQTCWGFRRYSRFSQRHGTLSAAALLAALVHRVPELGRKGP
jgi:hypothetical protein